MISPQDEIADPIEPFDECLSIGEMANRYNVSLRTLRFYEDIGLLHPARRGITRLFTARDRRCMEIIVEGKKLGLTLSEIDSMLKSHKDLSVIATVVTALKPDLIDERITYLEHQRDEIDRAIASLREALTRHS